MTRSSWIPATGALLEFDRTLDGEAHKLDVPGGALLSYTLYLKTGRVGRLGVTPSPR